MWFCLDCREESLGLSKICCVDVPQFIQSGWSAHPSHKPLAFPFALSVCTLFLSVTSASTYTFPSQQFLVTEQNNLTPLNVISQILSLPHPNLTSLSLNWACERPIINKLINESSVFLQLLCCEVAFFLAGFGAAQAVFFSAWILCFMSLL